MAQFLPQALGLGVGGHPSLSVPGLFRVMSFRVLRVMSFRVLFIGFICFRVP